MHLVGFIIRIYHDARSPERKKFLCLIRIHAMKAHDPAYLADAFLTSALTMIGELNAQSALSSGKETSVHTGQEAGRTPEPVLTP